MASYKNFFQAAREAREETQAVRKSPKKNKNRGPRKTSPFPLGLVIALCFGLGGSLWVLMNVEDLDSLLAKVEVRWLGLALAETSSSGEKTDQGKDEKKEKGASDESAKTSGVGMSPKNWTPEQIALFNKLEDRKRELDLKDQELQKVEEELQKQRVELENRVKELDTLRTKISERLTEKVGVDQVRVDKLVDIYSNMKPQTAAKVFEEIDEDLAVEILGKMKKKNMADILNLLKAEKAQRLSEKFAGYKRR